MEHDVYLCGWSQSDRGFELWVKSRPHIRGRGPTSAGAQQRLVEAIHESGGATQAVLEFDPPLPTSDREREYSHPELFLICGDGRFETDQPCRTEFESAEERSTRQEWFDAFFQAPCCRECGLPAGPRNERPIRLTRLRGGFDGGFISFSGTILLAFSEEFLELLETAERARLEFLRLETTGRRTFYELVGPGGPPFVGAAGLPISGWRCRRCGRHEFGYYAEGFAIHEFVAKADLVPPVPDLFTVGEPPSVQLCVTAERWAGMVGLKGTRGLVTRQLGVVDDRRLVRFPELEPLENRRKRLRPARHSL